MNPPSRPGIPKIAIWGSISLAVITAGLWALADLWDAEVARTIGVYVAIFLGVLVGCLFLIWLIKKLFVWIPNFVARRQETRAAARQHTLPPHDQSELDALQEQLQSVLKVIKESKLTRTRSAEEALYAVPWILLFGPEGSGKSTLLQECGVDFHFSTAEKRSSRNKRSGCDYWFSRDALVLDLSGGLGLGEEKAEIFKGFLHQLKRARKARPLDGVVVAVSVTEILNQPQENVDRLANQLRQRFAQTIRSLGIRFPVYLLFTQCDKMEGFSEFFGNFRSKDRDQVWGATISRAQRKRSPAEQIFGHEFDRLAESLAAYRLPLLASEKDSLKLAQIYTFPSRFASVRNKLASFVGTLLQPTPYSERPMLRGFYLTSAAGSIPTDSPRQEMQPKWDPGRRFAAAESPVRPAKDYFLQNLFPKIIFADRPLATASVDTRLERRRWMDIAFVGTALVCTLLLVGLTVSFTQNSRLIGSTNIAVLRVRDAEFDGRSRGDLSAFEELRKAVDRLDQVEQNGHSWLKLGWGLYTGDALYESSRRVYFRKLKETFVTPTENQLARRLRLLSARPETARSYDEFHNYLKAYLMMTSNPERSDEVFLNNTLSDTWKTFAPADPVLASNQLRFYAQHLLKNPSELRLVADQKTVELAQQALTSKRFSFVDRIYNRLKADGTAKLRQPFTLGQATGGKTAYLASTHDVPGIFTDVGWNTYFKEAIGHASKSVVQDDWVLGRYAAEISGHTAEENYQQTITSMYFDEYSEQWRRFLEGISMRHVSNLGEVAAALDAFTQQDSGLSQLFKNVAANTRLTRKSGDEGLLNKVISKAPKVPGLGTAGKDPEFIEKIAAPFRPLHDLVTSQPDKPTLLAVYLESLAKLQRQIKALSEAPWEPVRTYVSKVGSNLSGDEFHDSLRAAQSLQERLNNKWTSPVGRLLEQPIRQAWAVLITDVSNQLDARWKTQIGQSFHSDIETMYPFKSDGPDLSIAALSKYFKPRDGILADFYEKEVSSLQSAPEGLGRQSGIFTTVEFSREFQDFMQRVRTIRETFFSSGTPEPTFSFDLTTPDGIPGLEHSTLYIGEDSLPYWNEKPDSKKFTWPGKSGASRARISIKPHVGIERELRFEGEWALFKLLREAQINRKTPTSYTVTWSLSSGGGIRFDVQYRMQLNSGKNPFERDFFSGVHCPERITQSM